MASKGDGSVHFEIVDTCTPCALRIVLLFEELKSLVEKTAQ